MGDQQGVHQAGRRGAGLVAGAARVASSTYELPEYKEAAAAYAPITLDVMTSVDPDAARGEPAAVGGHPVRLDPGVPGRRQPVRPARGRLPRRPDLGRRRPVAVPGGRSEGRRGPPGLNAPTNAGCRSAHTAPASVSQSAHVPQHEGGATPWPRPRAHTTSNPPDRSSAASETRDERKRAWGNRSLLLPAHHLRIVLTQIPFLVTIGYSTIRWNLLYPQDRAFVGPGQLHVGVLLGRPVAVDQGRRSSSRVSRSVGAMLCGLGFALLLNRAFRGRAVARTLMITPFLIMPAAAALIWKYSMFDTNIGMINWALRSLGLPEVAWSTESSDGDGRDRADLAVHTLHDAHPARRAAGAVRWRSSRPLGSTAPTRCRPSAT